MFRLSLSLFRTINRSTRASRPFPIVSLLSKTRTSPEFKTSVTPSTLRFLHEPPKKPNMDRSRETEPQAVSKSPVNSPTKMNGDIDSSGSHAMTSRYPKSFPNLNPVDVYREHIAEQLASITGIEAPEIFTKLQWTQTQDKGDLMLPVPALRIKGKKPNELAAEWAEKVGTMIILLSPRILNSC